MRERKRLRLLEDVRTDLVHIPADVYEVFDVRAGQVGIQFGEQRKYLISGEDRFEFIDANGVSDRQKIEAYDRLIAKFEEPLHPELQKYVPYLRAVLDGSAPLAQEANADA